MQPLKFNKFGLKMPVYATKIVFLGFYPLNGDQCHQHPKSHFLEAEKYIKTALFQGSALDPAAGANSTLQRPSWWGWAHYPSSPRTPPLLSALRA